MTGRTLATAGVSSGANFRHEVLAPEDASPAEQLLKGRPFQAFPKMGKCYQIKHFLDLRGISRFFPQPNPLMQFMIKKKCLTGLTSLHSLI
jgi:hypothetical protein